MSSGEDIQAGRVTTAESTTDMLGAVPSEQDVDFNGFVILRVAPQPGRLKPNISLDGIHGVGNNGSNGPVASSGGTGVVGFGGPNEGTGIVGLGGGVDGAGGIGVHGTGGSSRATPTFDPNEVPGAGILGLGGRMADSFNTTRLSHGAGVIALAGGSRKPVPPLADTGSVGVYAQGAEAEVRTSNIDGVDTLVGPLTPGPGVLGRGGVPIPRLEDPVAAGVIGLAGDTPIPSIVESGNTGVYGAGRTGVFGHGEIGVRGEGIGGAGVRGEGNSGPGVHGVALDRDRGGKFESSARRRCSSCRRRCTSAYPLRSRSLQRHPRARRPYRRTVEPVTSSPSRWIQRTSSRVCTLWFCVQSPRSANPARWAQVLVGSFFDGQA